MSTPNDRKTISLKVFDFKGPSKDLESEFFHFATKNIPEQQLLESPQLWYHHISVLSAILTRNGLKI